MNAEPSNPSVYSLLGGLYMRQNRIGEAIAEFEEVARLQPNSVGASTLLGLLYYYENRRLDAEKAWRKALEVDPRAAAAANNLAWVYAEKGENLEVALQTRANRARGVPGRSRSARHARMGLLPEGHVVPCAPGTSSRVSRRTRTIPCTTITSGRHSRSAGTTGKRVARSSAR